MESITNEAIINHLLGRFEARKDDDFLAQCFSSDENAEKFERVRDDLIESYLRGDLSKADKIGFESYFLADPHNTEIFDFSKNLRGVLEKDAALAVAVTEKNHKKKSFLYGNWLIPALTFGALLVGAFFVWQIVSKNTEPQIAELKPTPTPPITQISPTISTSPPLNPTPLANPTPLTKPTETPKINTPPIPTPKVEPERTVVAFFLPLVSKGDEKAGALKIGEKIRQVQLQTAKPFKEFPAYQILVQSDGETTWQSKIEKFQSKGEGRIVVFVPVENLKTGKNRFIISGLKEDGTTEELKGTERFFEVEKEN